MAAQILARPTLPDEWAVCLRNYAWAHPGPDSEAFLLAKSRELLGNPAWALDPSAGYLEAFDTIVYAHGTSLLPELAALIRDRGQHAIAYAAFLTVDRLMIDQPTIILTQLVTQPELMAGREQSRAGLVARADVRDPAQRALLEQYLLDSARAPSELAAFAGLYPSASFMISNNLLTKVGPPPEDQLKARDRHALEAVEQWQNDPRFVTLKPFLPQIRQRLVDFLR
jgi:hypothetical protein